MSTDIPNGDNNEIELRELVYQSLEHDGLITRLKAQLRAAVFKTIEKASNPLDVSSITPAYENTTGRICRALVLDWLEKSNLLYTHDLLKVETSHHSTSLTNTELLNLLHLDLKSNKSQSILQLLLDHNHHHTQINDLPEHIKQSIDLKFSNEKLHDINLIREHFRSFFSSAFDSIILETFFNKNISFSSTTISKIDYEQICLKWLQACSKVLTIQPSSIIPVQPLSARNGQIITRARRSLSPPSESNSSSSSDNPRKGAFDFTLPTTMDTKKTLIKKSSDITPPTLMNFNNNNNNTNDNNDDDTSSSLFSERNATPAALKHLKNIEDIIRNDETPRTRTIIQKLSTNGHKDIPIEYDDDSVSQSQRSSIDDITIDKASPSPSIQIDFFEDL